MLHLSHLTNSQDLITTHAAMRAGFVVLALEKNRRATPFVAQARALQFHASQAETPNHLLGLTEIRAALLTAAGVSDKAAKYLTENDKTEAIQGLISNFLETAGEKFTEELVFRFLLTRGDTLGGTMRNLGGALAQQKLTRVLLATLDLANRPKLWLDAKTNQWLPASPSEPEIEILAKGLSWHAETDGQPRTLLYNLTVPTVRNNVDLCLLTCATSELSSKVYKHPPAYLALGELKGGIDPAGADEHWKTARTALQRIREAFVRADCFPQLFFIGAAIEKKMAAEIWEHLAQGTLAHAANLTSDNQLTALAHWLCQL